ncbi:unnamed protein product [Dibothriocephalus latus]|uniref:Uncharacterized protein n=1 Tax=Dibothriocephalus latus TaxID=60516 RepID=A0A3P6PB27_DIBLA|nr:unnamed protein product [Dibothriocephalus latus]
MPFCLPLPLPPSTHLLLLSREQIIIVYGARFLFVNVHSRPTKTRGEDATAKKLSNKLASEANSALAEAAHADRLMRSAGYRAPGLSGIRARDSLRSKPKVDFFSLCVATLPVSPAPSSPRVDLFCLVKTPEQA